MIITAEQIDKAFNDALELCADTEAKRFHRAVTMHNIKQVYKQSELFWPVMDAKQREVFDDCERVAKEIGIER